MFGLLIADAVTTVASLCIAFAFSWKLALVLLASVPPSGIILFLVTRGLNPAVEAQKQALTEASDFAASSVAAIDIVKVFGGIDQELRQYVGAISRAQKHYHVQARCNSLQMGYLQFWIVALFIIGFWYGVVLVDGGESTGAIITTFYETLLAFQGIAALLPQWLVLAKGMSAGRSLRLLGKELEAGRRGCYSGPGIRPKSCTGEVVVANVSKTRPS